ESPLRVNSPGGGFHLYFKAPKRDDARYEAQPGGTGAGIDGKYNGYAALPPSIHPNGKRYEWVSGQAIGSAADIPDWRVVDGVVRAQVDTPNAVGSLAGVERIMQALAGRDAVGYHSWALALASVRHWEGDTEGGAGIAYEIARQWSMTS